MLFSLLVGLVSNNDFIEPWVLWCKFVTPDMVWNQCFVAFPMVPMWRLPVIMCTVVLKVTHVFRYLSKCMWAISYVSISMEGFLCIFHWIFKSCNKSEKVYVLWCICSSTNYAFFIFWCYLKWSVLKHRNNPTGKFVCLCCNLFVIKASYCMRLQNGYPM